MLRRRSKIVSPTRTTPRALSALPRTAVPSSTVPLWLPRSRTIQRSPAKQISACSRETRASSRLSAQLRERPTTPRPACSRTASQAGAPPAKTLTMPGSAGPGRSPPAGSSPVRSAVSSELCTPPV